MKILGIDYGKKRIGLAISDSLQILATPMPTLEVKSISDAISKLQNIIRSQNAKRVIIGLPLGSKGDETQQSIKVRYFANALKASNGSEIEFWNESLSTKRAEEGKQKRTVRMRKNIDSEAARIILQEYLDHKQEENNNKGPKVSL